MRRSGKSTPQNDYDLLNKFVVDQATFFILSTPPFHPGRLFRFRSGIGPVAPGGSFQHSLFLKAPEALSGAQCRRKERRGGVRSELEL